MILVSGSIALDTLEGPHGVAPDELGGSALYFALAASLLTPVAIVAAVGRDDADRVRAAVEGRDIDLSGVDVIDAPTFRWRARHVGHGNQDLGRDDVIYDHWRPRVPVGSRWVFAGSMRPSHQLEFLEQARDATVRAADAMLSYVRAVPGEAGRVIDASNWFFANADELRALGGDPDRADQLRQARGLAGLCVKAGPDGARLFCDEGMIHVPALRTHPIVDTTGAGDALAAGFLARRLTAPEAGFRDALEHGIALASLTIEDVGLRALRRATPGDAARRIADVKRGTSVR